MQGADASRRQYAPPSTRTSSRHAHHAPPPSASANGPLTAERHLMEQIRLKLERAQQRLERRHAVESATPGSARYYPPNYTSAQAQRPAPPVPSVKLEELSHQYASSSGYLGAYPPPPSTRDPYASNAASARRAPPPTNSTRPTRQHAPPPSNYVPSSSRTQHHHHQQTMSRREHRQQYPPELQYRSASRNPQSTRGGGAEFTGAPLSTSAPFLAYASSSRRPPLPQDKKQLQNPPTSAIEVPPALQPAAHKPHRQQHDDTSEKKHAKRDESPPENPPASAVRATMASAMRSPVQPPPPSSRVRFEGYPSPPESDEAQRKKHEADKAQARQREKDQQLRDVLRQERQRRSVSRDAADVLDRVDKEQQRAETRTRRGSLPAPPKSEIDVSAFAQAALVLPPVSPSARARRSSSAAAVAPPKSAIQVSAFDEAPPVRRRSSAADEPHAAKQPPLVAEDSPAAFEPAKRDAHSDDDEYRTPPTSPSSGGSVPGSVVAAKEDAPPTEAALPISVKAVARADYDDAVPFVAASNQQQQIEEEQDAAGRGLRSPSRDKKKPFLSIWDNDDEDAIISKASAASAASARETNSNNQKPPSPAHEEPDPRLWTLQDEPEERDAPRASNQKEEHQEQQQQSAPASVLEFSDDDPVAPVQEAEPVVDAPVKEDVGDASSNQTLSPVAKPPAMSSRSRSNRPDLRSRISAAIQALNAPESGPDGATKSSLPLTRTRSPGTEPRPPRPLSPAMLPPSSRSPSAFALQRPPNTTTAAGAVGSTAPSSLRPTLTPTVTRPRPPLPPPPSPHSNLPAPPTTQGRRLRHKEPLELKRQLPPQIGVLAGLASGPTTFTLDEFAFYEIEWKVGEFGFSFQRVYAELDPYEPAPAHAKREMFLRMLLNTDRSTCKSFRDVHVGDILVQIGDTRVSDLGLDAARDSGSALTKYFTQLRAQTPMRLVFQRTEVLDWEGGVEL